MQIKLEGSTKINAPRDAVFKLLTDPNFLARTLPDAEDVRVLDISSLEAKMKLRVAVVSSTMHVKMTLADLDPPSRAKLIATGSGSGSNMSFTSQFELSGDLPTEMKWSADGEVTGVMAGLGSTLLKGFASKKVAEIFSGITKAIETAAS